MYPKHFNDVIGHREIEYNFKDIKRNCTLLNEAVIKYGKNKRKVIRYLAPHPPFPNLPYRSIEIRRRFRHRKISTKDLQDGYRTKLRWALEAVAEIYPHLGKRVFITSDHGEFLGENGLLFHGRSLPKTSVMCEVPWFAIKGYSEECEIKKRLQNLGYL
jgi:hypothetical protein